MSNPNLLRLSSINVDGLFNLYNHSVTHNLDERVTILHGPNGVGKTVLLQMANALLRGDFNFFRGIPFSRFSLGFDNGACLTLADQKTEGDDGLRTVWLTLGGVDGKIELIWSQNEAADVARNVPYLDRVSDALWRNNSNGELLAERDVIDRFGSLANSGWPGFGYRRTRPAGEAEDDKQRALRSTIWSFQHRTSAHLVEAQRLLGVESDDSIGHVIRRALNPAQDVATVLNYASDYQRRLAEMMALYGRKSQALDQSFPARLISAHDALEEEPLRKKMSDLDQKRADLKALGILDETPAHPSDVDSLSSLEQTDLRVMTLYVQDTDAKLSALDDFSQRTKLLVDNVNRKFLNKKIGITRDDGIVAVSTRGDSLALEELSSGEQHELVLLYDLLFRVQKNTIVLIDEPELSLHVAWQKQFLPELLEIVQTASFDAIIATHSPFIIGDRTDLMVGLGEDPE